MLRRTLLKGLAASAAVGVAGRRIELIVRDDGGVADNARRIVQDMIVNHNVGLIGIGITPTSLAIAPLVTEAKIPTWSLAQAPPSPSPSPPTWCAPASCKDSRPGSWPNGRPRTAAGAW